MIPAPQPPASPNLTPQVMLSARSSLDRGRGSFPRPLTPLIARDQELASIVSLVRDPDVRLLTLTGPGGVGKTRLAIAAADQVARDLPNGVVFVDLSSVDDPDLVLNTIAAQCGLRDMGVESVDGRLVAAIAERRMLLVLDNFEQVVAAAPRVRELLDACPDVKLLITSRLRLRISGEREFAVGPLPYELPALAEDAGEIGSVRLFVQRVQDFQPSFRLGTETMEAIAEICRRVDGLPLAIELAAARMRALPPAALLERLEQRLPLLIGGARDLPLRQQTIRDTIAWSYDLLGTTEQALFRRLGVFVGGFTIDAAEAVLGSPADVADAIQPFASIDVIDGITSLIDHSLLRQQEGSDGEPRYWMLETVREFARDRLSAVGEADAIRRRHAACFVAFAEAAGWARNRTYPVDRLQRLADEYDNLRAALGWLVQAGAPDALLRLAHSLVPLWILRGPYQEGRGWLEQALVQDNGSSLVLRRRALYGLGILAANQDDVERAETCFRQSLEIAETQGDPAGIAYAWFGLGLVAVHRRDFDQATTLLEGTVARSRLIEDQATASDRAGLASSFLGASAYAQNDLSMAASHFRFAIREHGVINDRWGISLARVGLAYTVRDQGDLALAGTLFAEALGELIEIGDHRIIALALDGVAGLAMALGHPERAARLLAAAAAVREVDGLPVEPPYRMVHERDIVTARATLGDDRFGRGWAEGEAMPLSMAAAEAMTIASAAHGTTPPPSPRHLADRLGLTRRETEVLRLLVQGMSDREIAEALSISERTAGNHVQHAMQKLGVDSRTAAAVFAARHDLKNV